MGSNRLNAPLMEDQDYVALPDALDSVSIGMRPSYTGGAARTQSLDRRVTARDYVTMKAANRGDQDDGAPRRRTTAAELRAETHAALASGKNRISKRHELNVSDNERRRITESHTESGEDMNGLTSAQAEQLLVEVGPNAVEEKVVSIPWMFFKQLIGIMPGCIDACFLLACVVGDYVDMIAIFLLLAINAVVGFREEYEAYCELQALLDSDIKTCRVKRDGQYYEHQVEDANGEMKTIGMEVSMLVPGDVISLKIGDVIPCDCKILHGNIKMDTKAVTGEPIPWNVPRKTPAEPDGTSTKPEGYAENEKGQELWGGCPITQGECLAKVIRTGPRSIVGQINQALAEKDTARKSDFEKKIIMTVQIIIGIAVIISIIMALVQTVVRGQTWQTGLKAMIAVLLGSVPVALPLVLLVTMSKGSVLMSEEKCVVTDLAALQDIASMTCLNSDKTGTITYGKMGIQFNEIWANDAEGFTPEQVLELATVASNRSLAKDDAIDGGVVNAWDDLKGSPQQGEAAITNKWKVSGAKGFNNASKRTETTATEKATRQDVLIIKGLPAKLLKNNDPNKDKAEFVDMPHTQFECKGYNDGMNELVTSKIHDFENKGLKTIGVAMANVTNGQIGEVKYVGILPMVDPPRADAAMCIKMMNEAGVEVKMVTGDAVNIAKYTCQQVGIRSIKSEVQAEYSEANVLLNTDMNSVSGAQLNQMVVEANGFAQVMPEDKKTVVVEEQANGWIVGFCGDGMNDAPALDQAHVGIAVADAMEAAIKASAMQLLDEGLQLIYTAIVESRKIFRRVKAYVVFRVAATIQMVIVLSVLLFAAGCSIDLIYIVILALTNDITMMPLSNDRQKASKVPDQPVVWKILLQSSIYGIFQAIVTCVFFFIANDEDGMLSAVKDSAHKEPVLWNNYLFSLKGIGDQDSAYPQDKASDLVNKYQTCMKTICPTYTCHTDNFGALLEDASGSCNNKCTDDAVFTTTNCYGLYTTGQPSDVEPCSWDAPTGWTGNWPYINRVIPKGQIAAMGGFCPKKKGVYSAGSTLPHWQECCVEYAGLKHPGEPHAGNEKSVCTEITTASMFVQLLISSELMIFPVRALGFMYTNRAATSLYAAVIGSVIVFSLLAAAGVPSNFGPLGDIFAQELGYTNMLIAWIWGAAAVLILDFIKISYIQVTEGSSEEIFYERVKDRMDAESRLGSGVAGRSTR